MNEADSPAEPNQRLELADNLFPDVMSGRLTDILCWNEDVSLGFLDFYSKTNKKLKATVLVTGKRSGVLKSYVSYYRTTDAALLESMQKRYPDIRLDTRVTFIEFMSPADTAKVYG